MREAQDTDTSDDDGQSYACPRQHRRAPTSPDIVKRGCPPGPRVDCRRRSTMLRARLAALAPPLLASRWPLAGLLAGLLTGLLGGQGALMSVSPQRLEPARAWRP